MLLSRSSRMATTPRSLLRRIRRPKPCLSASVISGIMYSSKAAAPILLDGAHAGAVQRIARRGEGHLVEHDQAQVVAGDVDAFPERARRQQHAVGRLLEPRQQRVARGVALGAHRPDDAGASCLQPIVDLLQPAPVGKQAERAPAAHFEQPLDFGGHRVVVGVGGLVVVGRQRRLVEQRLLRVVEDRRQHPLDAGRRMPQRALKCTKRPSVASVALVQMTVRSTGSPLSFSGERDTG